MTRESILQLIERTLLVAGAVIAGWCASVLIETRYTASLPLPVRVTASLPGDAGATGAGRPTGTSGRAAPARGSVVAKLTAPSLQLSATVLEGSDDATLSRGAGHIEDTAFAGEGGNIGIAGHRDTTFRPLRRVKPGDLFELSTGDRIYRYRVTRTLIVKPEDVYVLDPTKHPTLTLVTCYPFEFIGHAPKRFIVQAELER